jgi:guanylate kinase
MSQPKGPLIVLSGPSGSGKSTVIKRLLSPGDLDLHLSVSVTTRKPRAAETDGKQYHFWSRERFEAEEKAGSFLEWAEVFGNYYGTLGSEVRPYREKGQCVILEIDVQGAAQIRKKCPDAVSIFLRAASLDAYESRLRARGTESEDAIARRLAEAERELSEAGKYDYQVINEDLDAAVGSLRALVRKVIERT